MKISTVGRHLREGSKNVIRNGWMSFASASSIAISLFILGVFFLLAMNVNYLSKQIEDQVEIQVFLDLDITEIQIATLKNEIGMYPEVRKITFVSKDEGIEFLRERLGKEYDDLFDEFKGADNPLPHMFKVEVNDPLEIGVAATKIEKLNDGHLIPLITDVDYGKGLVDQMFKITRTVRNIGLVIVAGLAFTSMFLISNTIKLTIVARRREISIMKLVGATNSFIRWPFFIEGALLGLVGSLIPVLALAYGYSSLVSLTRVDLSLLMIKLVPMEEIGWQMACLLLGIGTIIGVWGSTVSVRKYLRV